MNDVMPIAREKVSPKRTHTISLQCYPTALSQVEPHGGKVLDISNTLLMKYSFESDANRLCFLADLDEGNSLERAASGQFQKILSAGRRLSLTSRMEFQVENLMYERRLDGDRWAFPRSSIESARTSFYGYRLTYFDGGYDRIYIFPKIRAVASVLDYIIRTKEAFDPDLLPTIFAPFLGFRLSDLVKMSPQDLQNAGFQEVTIGPGTGHTLRDIIDVIRDTPRP